MKKRVVLVIGGSKGIGRATAALFHKQGDQVMVSARSEEPLKEFQREHPGSEVFVGDMTDRSKIEIVFKQTFEQFGSIDVVVLSAAPFMSKPLIDVTNEEWALSAKYIDMIFLVNRTAAQYMAKQDRGVVVNISSRAGLREDVLPYSSVYGLIKNAMVGLVASANQESKNVQFIALCPGLVSDTDMGQRAIKERPGLNNGEGLTSQEVAETISTLVEGASDRTPHVYRLTKEDGLEVILEPSQI